LRCPVKLNVVDYFGCPGGGVRFVYELAKAIAESGDGIRINLISHGGALDRYRELFGNGFGGTITDIPPGNARSGNIRNIRGSWRMMRYLGIAEKFYRVPPAAMDDCDVVWCPWAQNHRMEANCGKHVVATYHDVIKFEIDESSRMDLKEERETLVGWLRSPSQIVTSADTCASTIASRFGVSKDRISVIPLTGNHAQPRQISGGEKHCWKWGDKPFLFCAANTMPHKNHEVLLKGVGAWGGKHPLVLTGSNTDLPRVRSRGRQLRKIAAKSGLEVGRELFPLGYVTDDTYFRLLNDAWAMVMPTLAEGGGSFPVWEALLQGLPVICSDIPIMREMLDRAGGRVILFNPRDPADLAAKLADLERNYAFHKREAVRQIAGLKERSWKEVAADYLNLIRGEKENALC
jgi:glycosyltransferase involved in cell wall biosynthesis